MKNKKEIIKGVVIYQGKNGGIEFKGDIKKETIWATQAQIAEVFEVQRPAITKHINNIFKTGELQEKAVCSILEHTAADGKIYKTQYYNLDMLLSIGYRVNSKKATEFRIWANKILKDYITQGFAINRKLVQKNYDKFLSAVEDVRKILPEHFDSFNSENALDLIRLFANTWLSLDAYDKSQLEVKKVTKESVRLEANELKSAVVEFKSELLKKGEATDLFATDRSKESLEGIVGNVMQSFGGQSVYKSVEEKAAHLLYFIIKNHPFVDGNKRTGAFSFIWYLNKNKRLDVKKVSPSALTAFTILVAESDPTHKENIVKLIMKLIER
jgi:prophage maintenance system killer protein/predicted regulator of amino acid metabolism with ACT domain